MAARGKEKQDFLKRMADLAAEVRERIAAEVEGFDPDPRARAERVRRQRADILFFGQTYFPHKVKGAPSRFHESFTARMLTVADDPEGGARELWKAPRGNAKTTWGEIYVIWLVVNRLKHFGVFLSDSLDQAAAMLESVKAELDTNPRLAADFPDACGQGPVWQFVEVVTRQGIKLKAGGARKRLRGFRHGAYRPDLVWCDDLENDENVKSPEQRQKLEDWLDKAVEPLGPPDGSMDLWYVGTVLHHDAVINRKARNPMWRETRFQAVIREPDRRDLWERWEQTLRNHGRDAARAFYDTHEAELLAGSEVLWPEVQPLVALMERKVRIGAAAFASEYQNDPVNADDQIFTQLHYWVERVAILREWAHFGAVDPSLGKNNKGRDPSAILVGAKDVANGRLFVLEALIRRRVPDRIITDVIELQREYACLLWAFETVQFQEFLRTELIKRSVAAACPVPARAVTPHTDKTLRIESLQPYVDGGLILLHPSQKVLIEQLTHFPNADHDDGPDGLHMLWTLAMGSGAAAGANADEPPPERGRDGLSDLALRFAGGPRRLLGGLIRRG